MEDFALKLVLARHAVRLNVRFDRTADGTDETPSFDRFRCDVESRKRCL